MSVKIIDKINAIYAAEAEAEKNGTAPDKKNTYYSYEYFPPKTAAGKFQTLSILLISIWLQVMKT